ncbi:MAG: hypothetical protein ACM30H_08805 [Clostridia bacterium]
MQLILEAVKVKCPECGHREFRPPEQPLPLGSALTCGGCGAKTFYRDLEQQAKLADPGQG